MGVRHFEKSAFRALFVHPEHNSQKYNVIMVHFQDNQGAHAGQSGEGNFQWAGVPARLPAATGIAYASEMSRRMCVCRLWRHRGRDARATDVRKVGKPIHPIALGPRGDGAGHDRECRIRLEFTGNPP
jgi:hypothetical protein